MAPVQVHVTQQSGTTSPLAVTIPSTTAGNTLVLKISTIGVTTSPTVSGVTLGGSATGWAAGPSESNTNHGICAAWIGSGIAGGQTALSVSFSGGSGSQGIIVTAEEWSGLTGTVDVHAGATGSSGTFSSGATGTTAQASEVAFGLMCMIPSSVTAITGPGSPWSNTTQQDQTVSTNTFEQMDGSDILSSTTTATYSGTMASNAWCALVFTVKASANVSVSLTTPNLALAAPLVTPGIPAALTIVSQYPVADNGGYAPAPTAVANTEGNALVAILATGSDNVSGFTPRLSVSDDAHNWWTLAASQTIETAGVSRRLDVWACANAKAASVVSVGSDEIYAGLAGIIVEVAGAPVFIDVDFSGFDTTVHGTSTTLSGTATTTDLVMSALALFGSNGPQTPTYPPALTTTFTSIATASTATDMSDIQLFAAYSPNTYPPSLINETWSWGSSAYVCGILLGFQASPPPPVQPNPNYPGVQVEAAFGFAADNQTGGNPAWTDITSRAIDDEGNTTLKSMRGRDYELTQPEAGELDVTLNNQDGALNPSNTSSPFYPNVVPEVPVRASFWWNGRRYGVGFSYASSFPQDFPYRQWGFVPFTGKDAIGVISQGSMPSAYGGEVLADFASTYYALGEFYEAPHGGLFANSSRFNQVPMVGWSPSSLLADYVLSTGLNMGLLGDPASGIGVTGIQAADAVLQAAGGAFVHDNSLPQFYGTSTGAAYEFWTTGVTAGIASDGPVLLSGWGTPWNYTQGSFLPAGEVFGIYSQPPSGNQAIWSLVMGSRAMYGGAGVPATVTLTGSGTWSVPTGVTSITVECDGAGDGGNGGSSSQGGSSGAGGATASSTLTVTPGTGIPYFCGNGGKGGPAGLSGFSASADTSWNSGQVLAKSATNVNGVSTPGQASASTGTNKFTGGAGGTATGTGGAGGGSSASSSANGTAGQSVTGSSGGNGGAGPGSSSGGRGGNAGGNAGNGGLYGAGGGGGGMNGIGGNGAPGAIFVTYTPATVSTSSEILNITNTSAQAALYHVVLTVIQSGSDYVLTLYVNGVALISVTTPTPPGNLNVTGLAVGQVAMQGGATAANNYGLGQVAVYPWVLPVQRILSHYAVGLNGRQNAAGDTTGQRVSALFQWSGLGVPYGIARADSMAPSALGNADQIQGSALADALYATTIDEGGMFYCPATAIGEVWYAPRQSLYNKSIKAVLGDNPTEVSNGNPSFSALTGWTLSSLSGTDAVDSAVPGGHAATLTVNTGSASSATALYKTPVTAGQTYTLAGYINPVTVSSNNLYAAEINWLNSGGGTISTSSGVFSLLANGTYSFVSVGTNAAPITAPAGAVSATFGPVISAATGNIAVNSQFKAGQFWLTCVSSEIPYDPGSGFDYSDTYLYNIVSSQRTVSTGTQYYIDQTTGQAFPQQVSTLGVNAIAADQTSETEYFPRGPLQQPVETVSDQDAYDRVAWSLAKYKQPQLRANQVIIHLAANPGAIDTVMRLEQGDVVTVNRRPAGAAVISLNCMIQKIEVDAGPDLLDVTLTLSPYNPENAVFQLDGGFNATIGNSALPW